MHCRVSVETRRFFSPANVYCFSQALMLGVAYLKLNPAMTDFSLFTWMVWIGGFLSFLGGCFLMNLVWTSRNGSPMICPLKLHCEYDWSRHFLFSFVAFGYFLIGVFFVISIAGNLILFTDSPGSWMGKNTKVGTYAVFFCSSPMVVSFVWRCFF